MWLFWASLLSGVRGHGSRGGGDRALPVKAGPRQPQTGITEGRPALLLLGRHLCAAGGSIFHPTAVLHLEVEIFSSSSCSDGLAGGKRFSTPSAGAGRVSEVVQSGVLWRKTLRRPSATAK